MKPCRRAQILRDPPRGPGESDASIRMLARRSALFFAVVVVLHVGCADRSEHESLHGTWRLDAETQEWLPRACVVLDFEEHKEPGFEVEQRGDEYRVRLNDRRGTTFHGAARDGVFVSRQIIPTTTTGRFCGNTTTLLLRLNLRGSEPGTLRGVWQTPDCGVCPDRVFGGERLDS